MHAGGIMTTPGLWRLAALLLVLQAGVTDGGTPKEKCCRGQIAVLPKVPCSMYDDGCSYCQTQRDGNLDCQRHDCWSNFTSQYALCMYNLVDVLPLR